MGTIITIMAEKGHIPIIQVVRNYAILFPSLSNFNASITLLGKDNTNLSSHLYLHISLEN